MLLNRGEGRAATPLIHSAPNVCNFAQTRALPRRAIAPLKGDQHDHDRAGVPRQRASMPVLGRVGERSGKQGRFLRPRRDLGRRCRSDRARRADREIDSRRTSAPSDGRGLTVPDGPGDQQRHTGLERVRTGRATCRREIFTRHDSEARASTKECSRGLVHGGIGPDFLVIRVKGLNTRAVQIRCPTQPFIPITGAKGCSGREPVIMF
jgi:hypothetical protein